MSDIRVVWKYHLDFDEDGHCSLFVPQRFVPLRVDLQPVIVDAVWEREEQRIFLWAGLDPDDEPKVTRNFLLVPTGNTERFEKWRVMTYVGILKNNGIVFHVFEVDPR